MLNLKKKPKFLILLVLIIIFSINTNFFKNIYEIILYKFDNRTAKKYNYCRGESIGYLLHLKKKYQINDNPKIINYAHAPSVNWAIINTQKINQNSKKLILLNYPGQDFEQNLFKINNNLFELNDPFFFTDKFSKIKNIKIFNSSNNLTKLDLKIQIYTVDKLRNKKNIKIFDVNNNLDMDLKYLNLNEKKLFFKINDNDIKNFGDFRMKIILKNRYILKDFHIINKYKNCYYLEQI